VHAAEAVSSPLSIVSLGDVGGDVAVLTDRAIAATSYKRKRNLVSRIRGAGCFFLSCLLLRRQATLDTLKSQMIRSFCAVWANPEIIVLVFWHFYLDNRFSRAGEPVTHNETTKRRK